MFRLFSVSQLPLILCVLTTMASFGVWAESGVAAATKDSELTEWVAGWREASSMLAGRTGAAVYVTKGTIHVIGGMGGVASQSDINPVKLPMDVQPYMRTTEYASVQPDNNLSPWRFGPELNTERGYFSVAAHGNYLYAVGGARGINGKELLASVERAEIKPDGTLGEWVMEKTSLNIPRRCVKLAVIGNYIYAFGGFGGILLDTVERAEINPDGTVGEWYVANDPMTVARYVHGIETVGEGVYNIGGHSKAGGTGIVDVEWSKLDEEDYFQPWGSVAPLQTGRYSLSTASHNGFIYAIGGLNGVTRLSSIERTRVTEEGKLADWEYTTPTPFAVSGSNAVVVNDRIYLLGGTNGKGYLRNAFYAGFNGQGDIGYRASRAEAQRLKTAAATRKASEPPLPHEAMVMQHFKQNPYSYLQVVKDNGKVLWLAGPAQDLQVGERISFPNGTLMKNFYSKALKRRFPYILFVTELRRLNSD